jgi:hypothetical protein
MTPYYKNVFKEHCLRPNNFTIRSEERLDTLSDKFLRQVTKYGKMYCPCQNVRNESTVCTCRSMRDCGSCSAVYLLKRT